MIIFYHHLITLLLSDIVIGMKKIILLSTFLFCSVSVAESLTLDCEGDVFKQRVFPTSDYYSNPISFKIFIEDLKNCNSKREDCGLGWIKIHPKWSNDSPDDWTQYDYSTRSTVFS